MIRLDTTTRKLQILLAGAITTKQLPVVACWSDKTSSAYTGGTTVSNTNSTTPVDIVAAPAASTVRDIDSITVRNADTAASTVILLYNDNGTTYQILTITLAVGDQLLYTHAHQWIVLDLNGNQKSIASGTTLSGWRSTGNNSRYNSVTPNTKFDLQATQIVLANASNQIIVRNNPSTITNDVSVAGPTANGRDQVAAFSASSWLHIYWISNGVTEASVSSTVAPPTGPTLPTGYTYWLYCGSVRFDGSSHLIKTVFAGSYAWRQVEDADFVLSSGQATTFTAVDLSARIPPNATLVRLFARLVVADVAVKGFNALLRPTGSGMVSGVEICTCNTQVTNITNKAVSAIDIPPGTSSQVDYMIDSVPSVGGGLYLEVSGYKMPNSGE